jgi:very-short-patch-repair endonuclease
MPDYTPQQFVEKWERAELKERASYQEHFTDLCHLVGHKTPAEEDPKGEFFTYEYGVQKSGGGQGFADVWYQGHFAIEYKGKGKYRDLNEAYQQLLRYREALHNPPLLVVCDIEHWEIRTNFTSTPTVLTSFTNRDILQPDIQRLLRALFYDPNLLHPNRTTDQVTAEAADLFKDIADEMRGSVPPERLAHFLTRLIFCLFAEDVGLLPVSPSGRGLFTEIVEETRWHPELFPPYIEQLFTAMADGGHVQFRPVRYFDGTLFNNITVEALSYAALEKLEQACRLDWAAVEPAIFGTLFERVIDPAKRAQLGLHYTSRQDIELIVEPVLMAPLRREWAAIQAEAEPLRDAYDAAATTRDQQDLAAELRALRDRMLARLRTVTVLDPACGSGNFLYVALQLLKNLEKEVITHPLWNSDALPAEEPQVHPRQLYGIEINEIAHDLASIVVWIGYIQWYIANGYRTIFEREPVLEPLDNVRQMDAILAFDDAGNPVEPEWPAVDVIVSNPPFLGGKKMRSELGDQYVDAIFDLWQGRVPHEADLVTYWFEKARGMIERGKAKRAGLLATNSIRGGANREVLKRIRQTGDIFMAWSDREWILEGAAVRVSMVGFDGGAEMTRTLDGSPATHITPDLTSTVDVTGVHRLPENADLAFMGVTPAGPFDISGEEARHMLEETNNPNGRPNSDVVRPYYNALDITRRVRDVWTIDFGTEMSEEEAAQYTTPFEYVKEIVLPARLKSKQPEREKENWWLFTRSRPELRAALTPLSRYIATPMVAKHRLFVWLRSDVVPANLINVIARDDDYFFGVLHSRLHEVWSLRTCTWIGKGNDPRYTPTTTFETFPFPWPPGQEPVTPTPGPSPMKGEGSGDAAPFWTPPPVGEERGGAAPFLPSSPVGKGRGGAAPFLPSPLVGEGPGMGGQPVEHWDISPALKHAMTEIAQQFRKNPTPSKDRLWQAIRERQLDGRKFRRQMPIGPFVVDFYCSPERLAVEVDGPIHESQREADRQRQAMIESLGIRFVRVTADQVEKDLPTVLQTIRAAFLPTPTPSPSPMKGEGSSDAVPFLPSPLVGEGPGMGGPHAAYLAISVAAQQLHAEREAWLNPPGLSGKALEVRTLTNLYNALAVFRGRESGRVVPAAGDFAPRLAALHDALDRAVCDAYGWEHAILEDEEEILSRLLALNLERAAGEA